MDRVETRTLMRTVFSKLKGYFRFRQQKLRLKLRANVHLKLKIYKKNLFALRIFKEIALKTREKDLKVKRFRIYKLKDKALAGFIRNLLHVERNRKMNFKALCFFKHNYLYKSFLRWKNLEIWLERRKFQKNLAFQHDCKRNCKKIWKFFVSAVRVSQDDKLVKLELKMKQK
jgi:hypothetical protein